MIENALRNLPSVDQLLHRDSLQALIAETGRETVRDRLREIIDELRREIVDSNGQMGPLNLPAEIERRIHSSFMRHQQSKTQRVINATGVVLHTNLGR